ncbi:MAG: Lysophospholipase [Verrucomicrobiaceae bacterium]|nr:Lysophospholipase [Verrucomicrobiaceae bacterium]
MFSKLPSTIAPWRQLLRSKMIAWVIVCAAQLLFGAQVRADTSNLSAPNLLVLGDSLSAAYGIPRERGWVTLLQQKLTNFHVVNAGISGDTTDGGLARLPALLQKYKPTIVVIELGGNDALRGFQIQRIRDNLEQLIKLCQNAGAKVLLVGMKIPPNYGLRYTSDFFANYTDTAKKYSVPLVPFFMEGIATHPELMQDDGIHPRAEAQQQLLDNVWPYLQKLL